MKTFSASNLSAPSKLTSHHIIDDFDCGYPALNNWLCRYALQNQQANAAMTYVVCKRKRVVGYYSLAVGSVEPEVVPARIKKGLARHPIPIMVLARLTVDIRCQGRGIGKGLLKDAVLRTLQAAEFAGIRAIFVNAKDDTARGFYERFDFEPSPVDPLQLMLLIKKAQKSQKQNFKLNNFNRL